MRTSIVIALCAISALFACDKKSDAPAAVPAPSASAVASVTAATPDAAAAPSASVAAAPPATPPPAAVVAQTPSEQDYEEKAESAITTANAASELSRLEHDIGP